MYHHIKPIPIIHTQSCILVLGLGLSHMLFYDDRPCTIISEHTSIIHTQSRILVLGLGLGHVFFHDDWPSYQSIPPSPILNHTYWYWALVLAMCCFMITDHVISHHPPLSILNHIYTYICTYMYIPQYIFITMYIWKNPIPNTQFPKRISKDPVSANILPEYWPSVAPRTPFSHMMVGF